MQTVYPNTIEKVTENIDKKVMCLGKNILFYSRFGLGDKNTNIELYTELSILKEAMCIPTCVDIGMIMEIINKKVN